MKSAIVTGASSGIGLAISERLVSMGYKVFGFGRSFGKTKFSNPNFIRTNCDVTNLSQMEKTVSAILNEESELKILINNAGLGIFSPHEEIPLKSLDAMLYTNFNAPVLLTRLCLRELKKNEGHVINISSITAKKASFIGAGYAASKAGLTHFSENLFEEVRKSGVRVTTIHPDLTKTNFYDKLNFSADEDPESYLSTDTIANAVEQILIMPNSQIVTEITIRPKLHKISKKKREV